MKTNRSATKRFRVTPKGKVLYVHSGLRHNLGPKSAKRKRRLGRTEALAEASRRTVDRLLARH